MDLLYLFPGLLLCCSLFSPTNRLRSRCHNKVSQSNAQNNDGPGGRRPKEGEREREGEEEERERRRA